MIPAGKGPAERTGFVRPVDRRGKLWYPVCNNTKPEETIC